MIKSDSIKELATALAKAQAEMKNAPRAAANSFYKSKYADLAGIWDVARGPLTKHGLSIVQTTRAGEDGKPIVETFLLHESGEWISGEMKMNPVRQTKGEGFVAADDPQAIGSAITYARRYGLAAIAGVATEDDDGNAATGRTDAEEDSRPTAVALDAVILKKIEDAKTLPELSDAWNKIPVGVRRGYAAAKDTAKARIAQAKMS